MLQQEEQIMEEVHRQDVEEIIDPTQRETVLQVTNLSFQYPQKKSVGPIDDAERGIIHERSTVLDNVNFEVKKGARVLVVGGNGAGKSTLLSIIGGKKMVAQSTVKVFGRSAFHDTTLNGEVCFLGDWWTTNFFLNCKVSEMLDPVTLKSERVQNLSKVLAVNLNWIVNRVSDGQRRRCQLLIGLAHKKKLYVLDEVTTDLDVIARDRLLQVLRQESENGATVLYATHIFDNLESWATDVLRLHQGKVTFSDSLQNCDNYQNYVNAGEFCPLYKTVRDWIQEDWDAREALGCGYN